MLAEIPAIKEIFKCRVCQSEKLTPLFSLGEQYISNFLEPGEDPGIKCPIDLVLCENCTLVQLKHTAPQEILYSRKYWYRSSVTKTMRDALRNITEQIESLVDLNPGDVVLDIGSNDGELLRSYNRYGLADEKMSDPGEAVVDCDYMGCDRHRIVRVGVEPADNLQKEGHMGVDVLIHDFWSYAAYLKGMKDSGLIWRDHNKAKVITAVGMFYDLDDPSQFIADVARALAPDGLFVAQLMTLRNMIQVNDVGNICHEHLEFYSLYSLCKLFSDNGLDLVDIETNSVNGQSDRLFVRHHNQGYNSSDNLRKALDAEVTQELHKPEFYRRFHKRIMANAINVRSFIENAVRAGKDVCILGASTKGNTILQTFGIDHTLITCAAERSPEKWGKVTVGTNIPIVSEKEARATMPDYFLVLPFAFLPEFIEREKNEEWRKRGGQFLVPLPEMRLV